MSTELGRLHVEVRGSGPAVLLWPSLLLTGSLWDAQVALLAPAWTTLAVDPPGHGASEPLTQAFTLAQCATAVTQVLDAVGVERAHLVGNSWGGMVAGTTAALHPGRTRSAVLLNGTASAAPHVQRLRYAAFVAAGRRLGGIRGPLLRAATRAFLGPTTRRERPEVVARVQAAVRAVDVDSAGWAVTSVVTRRPDQRALFGSITAPVLVVAGDEDATFPLPETRALAAAVPGSAHVVLDGVAHLAALEDPRRTNELLAAFLADPAGSLAARRTAR